MNLKNHPFFKKYRTVKIVLLVHFIFSLIICVTQLVHGFIDKDVLGTFEKPFENYKAFHHPEKYLKKDVFVVDTAFISTETSSSQGKSTFKDITVIRGNLLHSTKKQELRFAGIKVWRNTINDEVFLGNKKDFESAKTNATLHIYFYFSLIPLLIILLILKRKSR